MRMFVPLVSALICILLCDTVSSTATWNYDPDGGIGPADWAGISGNDACDDNSQSPINIVHADREEDDDLRSFSFANYEETTGVTIELENTGHTVNMAVSGVTLTVSNGDLSEDYEFAQLHFHWGSSDDQGSEHTIDGTEYPLEMHLVHFASETYDALSDAVDQTEGLAVLGFLFEIQDDDNENFDALIAGLSSVTNADDTHTIDTFVLKNLFRNALGSYYRYSGSLTTPPCYESVVWTVFRDTIGISSSQMAQFRTLMTNDDTPAAMEDNYRPVQDLGTRTVYYYHAHDDDGVASVTMSIGLIVMATIVSLLI